MLCGKLITCWDYLKRPCQREEGHVPDHCNPFSSEYPMEEIKPETPHQLYEKVLQAAGLAPNKLTA